MKNLRIKKNESSEAKNQEIKRKVGKIEVGKIFGSEFKKF